MSITTHQTKYGQTVVQLRGGCTDKINIHFNSRKDALALLLALRKRAR